MLMRPRWHVTTRASVLCKRWSRETFLTEIPRGSNLHNRGDSRRENRKCSWNSRVWDWDGCGGMHGYERNRILKVLKCAHQNWLRPSRQASNHARARPDMPKLVCSRLRRMVWPMISNAALRSNDISAVDEPSWISWLILSRASNRANSVENNSAGMLIGRLKLQEDVVWYWMRDSIRRSRNLGILLRLDIGR